MLHELTYLRGLTQPAAPRCVSPPDRAGSVLMASRAVTPAPSFGSECAVTTNEEWWAGTGLNRRHQDFQSCALPTELPARAGFREDEEYQISAWYARPAS